jgi:hypothetical protein
MKKKQELIDEIAELKKEIAWRDSRIAWLDTSKKRLEEDGQFWGDAKITVGIDGGEELQVVSFSEPNFTAIQVADVVSIANKIKWLEHDNRDEAITLKIEFNERIEA